MSGRNYVFFLILVLDLSINDVHTRQRYHLHPDTGLNISQLLERRGYPFEHHEVQTEDGYLLGLHRIPYGVQNTTRDPKKPVALFVHGMVSQSIDFVNNEPEKSLGLLLADNGYDVWLLNTRGNTHSRRHAILDPDQDKEDFWDYSWHEIGIYDLPNTIDYILALTKQEKLFYFGFSRGTTTFLVMASMKPEYNSKIRHFTAVGPAAFMTHNYDIRYRTLARINNILKLVSLTTDVHEVLVHRDIYLKLVKRLCLEGVITPFFCHEVFDFIGWYSPNMTLLPVYVSNSPSGCSVKECLHFLQIFKNGGHFRQYDYGAKMNLVKYGNVTPPDYNLSNIVAPITLHYAKRDQLTNFKDVEILATRLPNAKKRMVPMENTTHFDLLWGNHIRKLLLDYILEDIQNY